MTAPAALSRSRVNVATHGREHGFTLLEMVIAIAIFAVIAAISYAALDNFLAAKAHIDEKNAQAKNLQTTFVLLEQDLRYAVNRTVRNGYGDVEPAFIAAPGQGLADGERLRLTTIEPAAEGIGIPVLTRVAWRLNDGELSRVTWRVLDRDVNSPEYRRPLLGNVQDVTFTFFSFDADQKLETSHEWTSDSKLPVGVEVSILLAGKFVYQRVFEVRGG
jgi:general secretion pathway protein J